jgi:hypothetical protein
MGIGRELRQRPIMGWIAVDGTGALGRLSLVNGRGTIRAARDLTPDSTSRSIGPGKASTGFSGWIDIRTAAERPLAGSGTSSAAPRTMLECSRVCADPAEARVVLPSSRRAS